MSKRVYRLGVTATRRGLTDRQRCYARSRFGMLLLEWDEIEFHHGRCVGGDEEVLLIAKSFGVRVRTVSHPASMVDPKWISQITSDVELPAKPPLQRNRDIVDIVNELLAYPGEQHEVLRSGTWATIRYADQIGRTTALIHPAPPV